MHAEDFHRRPSDALVELGPVHLRNTRLVARRDTLFGLDGDDFQAHLGSNAGLDEPVNEFVAHRGFRFEFTCRVRLRHSNQVLHALPRADGAADVRPFEAEGRLREVPAAILLADDIFLGDAHVFEEHFVELMRHGHVDERAHSDTRRLHVHHEVGDAAVLRGLWVRPGQHDHPLGDVAARGPDLLAVHHIVVAVADCASLQAGEVAARARFAVALTPHGFAVEDLWEVLLLLCFGPVDDERRARKSGGDAARPRCAGFGHLPVEDELFHHAHPGAAVLLGPGGADPVFIGKLLHPTLPGVAGSAEPAFSAGHVLWCFGFDEAAHLGAERCFFGRIVVVHASLAVMFMRKV